MKIFIFVLVVVVVATEILKRVFGSFCKGFHDVNEDKGALLFGILAVLCMVIEAVSVAALIIIIARLLLFGA